MGLFSTRRRRFIVAALLMVFAGSGASVVEHVESRAAAFGFALGAVIFGSVLLVPWILWPRETEGSQAKATE